VQSGSPSVITDDLKDKVDAHVHENRLFSTDELHGVFPCGTTMKKKKVVFWNGVHSAS
jgi:hypothetical protein